MTEPKTKTFEDYWVEQRDKGMNGAHPFYPACEEMLNDLAKQIHQLEKKLDQLHDDMQTEHEYLNL